MVHEGDMYLMFNVTLAVRLTVWLSMEFENDEGESE